MMKQCQCFQMIVLLSLVHITCRRQRFHMNLMYWLCTQRLWAQIHWHLNLPSKLNTLGCEWTLDVMVKMSDSWSSKQSKCCRFDSHNWYHTWNSCMLVLMSIWLRVISTWKGLDSHTHHIITLLQPKTYLKLLYVCTDECLVESDTASLWVDDEVFHCHIITSDGICNLTIGTLGTLNQSINQSITQTNH